MCGNPSRNCFEKIIQIRKDIQKRNEKEETVSMEAWKPCFGKDILRIRRRAKRRNEALQSRTGTKDGRSIGRDDSVNFQSGAFSSVRLGPGAAQFGERRDATRGKPFSCLSGKKHPTRMRGRSDESIYSTSGRSRGTDATPTLSRARYVETVLWKRYFIYHGRYRLPPRTLDAIEDTRSRSIPAIVFVIPIGSQDFSTDPLDRREPQLEAQRYAVRLLREWSSFLPVSRI